MSAKATTAAANAPIVVSVDTYAAVRREMAVPANVIASAEASGSSRQIQAPAAIYPRSVLSLSTSSSTFRRPKATIRPRPTTTSEAATAITEIAKIWPPSPPCSRDIAIRSRLAEFSMISTESRMISGFRRSITPSEPIANRSALRTTYHWMSGPCIRAFQRLFHARVRPEHDAADRGDEQDDRRDLEREQVIGQEGTAERL